MSRDELRDARAAFLASFVNVLEATFADNAELADARVIQVFDDLDDAAGELLDAILHDRATGRADA